MTSSLVRTTQTNPQAAIIVFNYRDRMSAPQGAEPSIFTHIISDIIIPTASIRSIVTQKAKAEPAGTFEIVLAPTYNWAARLTVGSWLAILMTKDKNLPKDLITTGADKSTLKMLGRIDSVRVNVAIDPETGARNTSYVINGRDWGAVFECIVYLDALNRSPDKMVAGMAEAVMFKNLILEWNSKGIRPTTTEIINGLKNLWGAQFTKPSDAFKSESGVVINPSAIFHMPQEVAEYMKLKGPTGEPSTKVADLVQIVYGRLIGQDKYVKESEPESVGVPDVSSLIGSHTLWQLMIDFSNPIINELIADLRWEKDQPMLALYKRVKPFLMDEKNLTAYQLKEPDGAGDANTTLKYVKSPFYYVKRFFIPSNEVITINAGTNWRDKINFIEIMYDESSGIKYVDAANAMIKSSAQTMDDNAFTREGLKAMILKSKFTPDPSTFNDGANSFRAITHWKWILREWFFNTHNMLNGSVSFIGQNDYLGVGDNIVIPSKVFGRSPNYNQVVADAATAQQPTWLLAHVEAVTHQFAVNEEGARSFVTTVHFVRGIFIDKATSMPILSGNAVDPFGSFILSSADKNPVSVTTNISNNIGNDTGN